MGLEQAAPGGEALPVGSHRYCGVVVDDGPDAAISRDDCAGPAARTRGGEEYCRATEAAG